MNKIYPGEGDKQLFKQAPGRMVDVEAGKKGVLLRLKMVLKSNPTTSRGAPEGEVKLPPAEGIVLPDLPCLICHCNVSSERWVLIVGEAVREHGLKVTPFIVDHAPRTNLMRVRSPSPSLSAVIRKRYPCTSELTKLSSRHNYLVDVLEVRFYF